MVATVYIEVDDRQVLDAIKELTNRLTDMAPAMQQIAGHLAAGIERAFDLEADPATGTPWQRLSAVTIQRREQHGHWPGKKLQVTGALVSSIVSQFGSDFAAAGTSANIPYAKAMNFGMPQGYAGRDSRGRPIPWGDIPPRPFIGLDETAKDDVLDVVRQFLASAVE